MPPLPLPDFPPPSRGVSVSSVSPSSEPLLGCAFPVRVNFSVVRIYLLRPWLPLALSCPVLGDRGGGGLVPSRHPIQFALVELAEASFPPDLLQKPEEQKKPLKPRHQEKN